MMLSKSKIKLINSLRYPKYRKQHQLFVVEGSINVVDFLKSPLRLDALFATERWLDKHQKTLGTLPASVVDLDQMKKLSALATPSEVLAVFQLADSAMPNVDEIDDLVLVLDGIKDPGNMGTIIRTADWFGIQHIFCSLDSVDVFGSKVVQASMGSLARVNVISTDLLALLRDKKADWKSYGAYLEGENLAEIAKPKKGFIVIGSEAHGISDYLESFIDCKLHIPPWGNSGAESLNASIATGIICYGLRTQTR